MRTWLAQRRVLSDIFHEDPTFGVSMTQGHARPLYTVVAHLSPLHQQAVATFTEEPEATHFASQTAPKMRVAFLQDAA